MGRRGLILSFLVLEHTKAGAAYRKGYFFSERDVWMGKRKQTVDKTSTDEDIRAALAEARVSICFIRQVLRIKGVKKTSKIKWGEAWSRLLAMELVTNERYVEAMKVKPSTFKCRLDRVASPQFVARCKEVSRAASRAARRASLLMNIIVLKAYEEGVLREELPALMNDTNVNNLVRRCGKTGHPYHLDAEREYGELLPVSNDVHLLDNAIQGSIRRRLITSMRSHMKTHFGVRIQNHVERELMNDKRFEIRKLHEGGIWYKVAFWENQRLDMWYRVKAKLLSGNPEFPESLVEKIQRSLESVHCTPGLLTMRELMEREERAGNGDEDGEDSDDEDGGNPRIDVPWVELCRCHVAMSLARRARGQAGYSAVPVGEIGRVYFEVNASTLDRTTFRGYRFDLQGALERLTVSRNATRRRHRRKHAAGRAMGKVRRRGCGRSKIRPGSYVVKNISTDGVGCSIHVRRFIPERTVVIEQKDKESDLFQRLTAGGVHPRLVGIDPGRRNLFYSSENLDVTDRRWKTLHNRQLSRENYRRNTGQKEFERWEAQRRIDVPLYGAAIAALTARVCRTCDLGEFREYVRELSVHRAVLEEELFSDERAERTFERLRKKRSVLDKAARAVVLGIHPLRGGASVDPGLKERLVGIYGSRRPVIVCYGSAKLRSGGRGEVSVPVNKVAESFYRAVRQYGLGSRIVRTWEHLTTAMCHRCKVRNEKRYNVVNGVLREDVDYRFCRGHDRRPGYENSVVRLNRDKIGSINIGIAGEAVVRGELRPVYLGGRLEPV